MGDGTDLAQYQNYSSNGHLSCKSPENLDREIRVHFLVHNLVRRLMLETARRHGVPLERVSFAGSLAGRPAL